MLYSWKFFPNNTRSHWLLLGHTTSNNETASRENLENPSIRTTETRFYEPARLSTPLTQTLVLTKTAGRHKLAEVVVI